MKQTSLDWFINKYGEIDGTNRYNARRKKISETRLLKNLWNSFYNYDNVSTILGDVKITDDINRAVNVFFRDIGWKKHRKLSHLIAHWIVLGILDWKTRYEALCDEGITSSSLVAYQLRYGELIGNEKYQENAIKKTNHFTNKKEFWIASGLTESQAIEEVSKIQKDRNLKAQSAMKLDDSWKKRHRGFYIYWINKGLSDEEAEKIVGDINRRDKAYYINRYGDKEGNAKYEASKHRRCTTWTTKDKIAHSLATVPGSTNTGSQEYMAIKEFMLANNINPDFCKHGKPKDQFWQIIPNVGFRRYDLAVFEDETRTKLKLIFEYHGAGHVNFSDYNERMKNEYIQINGRTVRRFGTYGEAYENDTAKRNHILAKYPDVDYIIMWTNDLKEKRFTIDELRSKKI